MKPDLTPLVLEASPNWKDYQLLDSGDGKTLERFGPYFIRPRPSHLGKNPASQRMEKAHACWWKSSRVRRQVDHAQSNGKELEAFLRKIAISGTAFELTPRGSFP